MAIDELGGAVGDGLVGHVWSYLAGELEEAVGGRVVRAAIC
jgi:hypothetical protein